jgi:hypothetical protein
MAKAARSKPAGKSKGGKPPRRARLTPKQKKVFEIVAENPEISLREAGERAGYKGDTAESARRALESPNAHRRMRDAIHKAEGMSVADIVKRLREGLNAKVIKYFSHEGEVTDKKVDVDLAMRLAYIDRICKLGDYDPKHTTELTGADGRDLIPPAQAGPDFKALLADLDKPTLLALLDLKATDIKEPEVPQPAAPQTPASPASEVPQPAAPQTPASPASPASEAPLPSIKTPPKDEPPPPTA